MDNLLIHPKMMPEMIEALEGKYNLYHMTDPDSPNGAGVDPKEVKVLVGRGSLTVSAQLIDSLPNLEAITIFGVGYDGVNIEAAKERGIAISHTPGVLTDDVANLAVGLALALTRRIRETDTFNRQGKWLKGPPRLGTSVYGKTVGILGLGRIGLGIAQRMKACGSKIAYSDVAKINGVDYDFHADAVSLAEASQVLFISCVHSESTHKIVNKQVLDALGPKGFLVNTARGSIVDEKALIQALKEGHIAGAALDVFEEEPTFPGALAAFDNTILTPHIGSSTYETRVRMAELVVRNIEAFFAHEPLPTLIPEMR